MLRWSDDCVSPLPGVAVARTNVLTKLVWRTNLFSRELSMKAVPQADIWSALSQRRENPDASFL
jgi:hypothetical protein